MQGLIIGIILLMQVPGPIAQGTQNIEYIGQLPEIAVAVPRYENEDIAWSGMMSETNITAPRYTTEEIAAVEMLPAIDVTTERPEPENKNYEYCLLTEEFNLSPNFAYAQTIDHCEYLPVKTTLGDNYDVPEGDTVCDDVTVSGGNARIDGVIDGDLAVMGGRVKINGTVDGDVAVMGGNLDLFGTITGDAAVFGGNINNKGTIQGDLLVIGGTVLLDSGSVIEGDINMVGGTVDRDTNATVLGDVESVELPLQEIMPRIGKAFRFPHLLPGTGVFQRVFLIAALIVIYIVCLLVFLIFPTGIDRVVDKIKLSVWASVGFGLGIELLFVPLIVLFAVSIIGIPLIPVFVLAVFLASIFGFSALSCIVGDRVANGFKWKIESRVGLFSLGWIGIMIIPIIVLLIGPPISALGMVIVYVAATIGMGGVIYALIKKNKKGSKK